jgi:hypothetical protein
MIIEFPIARSVAIISLIEIFNSNLWWSLGHGEDKICHVSIDIV